MKSKTIILSKENESGRGILTLFEEDGLLQCRLRLYNFKKLNRYCKIGIYHQKQVFSSNLLEKNDIYSSSLVGSFDIEQDFFTAIVDTSLNNEILLCGGTYAGFFFNDHSDEVLKPFNSIEKENPNTSLFDYSDYDCNHEINTLEDEHCHVENDYCEISSNCDENCDVVENTMDDRGSLFSSQDDSEGRLRTANFAQDDNIITQDDNECHVEQHQNIPQSEKCYVEHEQNIDNNIENTIKKTHEALLPQFKYLFENYPKDDVICSLLSNSKFVKIEEKDSNYSIGAIFDDDEIKFICYAVLCDYNSPIPTEIGEHYQWLPINKDDPLSDGYYIVFQDATDLKIINIV